MARKVITIDGLAASGKSTIAKHLADKLGYVFLSSGMLYRAVGLLALENSIDFEDVNLLVNKIKESKIDLKIDESGEAQLFLNNKNVTEKVRAPEVSEAASSTAKHEPVRAALLDSQRGAYTGSNIVVEGRDMGTVVFPDANLKFFIKCDENTLINRRLNQLYGNMENLPQEEANLLKSKMKMEIQERNKRDIERKVSPTIPAKEAIIVDNSSKTLTELLDFVYSTAQKAL